MGKPVCIDLFCGAGGLSEGLFRAGFRVAAGFDHEEPMLEIYRRRFARRGTMAIRANLQRMKGSEVLRKAGVTKTPALVCGGPPCQGFSGHRRGKGPDLRNRLVLAFVRIAVEIRPRAILLENVAGLTHAPHDRILRRAVRRLEAAGYRVEHRLVDASDYGLPQKRRRLFLIALRGKVSLTWPRRASRRTTIRDAIGDLPSVRNGHKKEQSPYRRVAPTGYQRRLRGKCRRVHNHLAARLSETNMRRIRRLRTGDDWRKLPRSLLTAGMRRARPNSHTTRFGRLRWSQQSGTVLTRFDDPKNGAYIHPEDDRTLTIREAARLQGFPDGFVFSGARHVQQTAVGNAVPPLVAEVVARRVLASLTRRRP